MLNSLWVVFDKEFKSYFRSKLVWFVFITYAMFTIGGSFLQIKMGQWKEPGWVAFLGTQLNLLLLVIPALTIKLWSEEKKIGTFELTISLPVNYTTLTVGKFLAVWGLCGLMLVSTMGMWCLTSFVIPLNNWVVLQNYLLLWFICGALSAISLSASVFTANPVSAFVVSLTSCLFVAWFNITSWVLSGDSSEVVLRAGDSLSFRMHFQNLMAGQISMSAIFYYMSLIVFALWFNVVSVGWRRK